MKKFRVREFRTVATDYIVSAESEDEARDKFDEDGGEVERVHGDQDVFTEIDEIAEEVK